MEWKPEYAIIFFLVLVGSLFQFANSKNEEALSIPQRLISLVAAATFGGILLVAVLDVWWKVHFMISFALAIPMGIQAEKFLRLWMAYGQEATGLIDFIDRMKVAYKTAKSDSTKTENDAKP